MNSNVNIVRRQTKSFARSHAPSPACRALSLSIVLCFIWCFTAFPATAAIKEPAPQKPRPHSLPMSREQKTELIAQVAKANALRAKAKAHYFNYAAANANRKPVVIPPAAPQVETILDDVGNLAYSVPSSLPGTWNSELAHGHPTPVRSAQLRVWLGEWQLASNKNPKAAISYFDEVLQSSKPSQAVYGRASYDRAMATYSEGAYREADRSFAALLAVKPRMSGFSMTSAALWLRHAGACAGYHADRSRAGIPEPARLDPNCGAAALASSLRALGQPYDKHTVLAAVRVTGEGSNLGDVVNGSKKLGLNAWVVRADDSGLINLPKPIVAFVEHDHFISVISASKKGVSYLCSDCGPWPGGQVNLNWRQWHMLEGGLYVVTTKPGSVSDNQLSLLKQESAVPASSLPLGEHRVAYSRPSVLSVARVAFSGLLSDLHLAARPDLTIRHGRSLYPVLGTVKSVLYGHVYLDQGLVDQSLSCGTKNNSNQCPNYIICPCPKAGAGPGGSPVGGQAGSPSDPGSGNGTLKEAVVGPSAGDPVNLATGEEEYTPPADLNVYNPVGPQVTWQRTYDSLRSFGQGFSPAHSADYSYQMNDYGLGWSNNYNVGVADPYPGQVGTSYPKSVFFVNGAHVQFTVPSTPTSGSPEVLCQNVLSGGVPYLVYANYGASGNYYTIVFNDRTKWVTKSATTINSGSGVNDSVYPLGQIVDRNGNYINFNYGPATGATYNVYPMQWPLLSSITNQNGTALLTIVRVTDGSGAIAAIYDCYGRSVLYHVLETSNYAGPEFCLDHVSQIVPTGAGAAPDRYAYAYINGGQGYDFLNKISVPSPTGTGMSTATISYDSTYLDVTNIVDGNGNKVIFTSATVTGTAGGSGAPGSTTPPLGVLTATGASAGTTTNYCRVQYENAAGTVAYSYIAGYDMNMDYAIKTDGAGRVIVSKVFSSSSSDPYKPSSSSDGNGNVTSATFDTYGNMLTLVNPRGVTTTHHFSYSSFPLGEEQWEQDSYFSGGSTIYKTATNVTYDDTDGYYDANGIFWPSGAVSAVSTPTPGTSGGTGSQVTTSFTYDVTGQGAKSMGNLGLGNELTITDPGNNVVSSNVTTFNYTTDGVYSQSAALRQPITMTDNLGNVTHLRYDARSNPISAIDALGNETDFAYTLTNAPLKTTFAATGQTGSGHSTHVSSYLYSPSLSDPTQQYGPLVSEADYDESGTLAKLVNHTFGLEGEMLTTSGGTDPETMTYDAYYRDASLSDGNGNTTTYSYTTYGYLARVNYPGAGTATSGADTVRYTSYDADGNVTQRIDGRGITTNYTYSDPESKVTAISYPASTGINVGYTYDGFGRKLSMSDGSGSTSYTYGDNDSVTSIITTYTGLSAKTISYSYYADGSIETVGTPAGNFSYSYDGLGRMTSLMNPLSETSSWTYQANNWLSTQSLGNGVITTYTYNARRFVIDLVNKTSSGTTLSDFNSMAYDSVGDRTSMTASVPAQTSYSGTTTYSYDAVGTGGTRSQLIGESSTRIGSYSEANTYDTAGNPTKLRGTSLAAYNSDNQTTASAFSYDGNGNPTTYASQTATFDAENRLTAFGSTLTAGYTADNLRASKTNSAGTTYYLYDGINPVCELNSSGTVTAVNTFGANGLLSRYSGSSSTFYTFDPSGNPVQRLDSSENIIDTSAFDGFGSRTSTGSSTDPYSGFGSQWGYYLDSETGLNLLSHRYYDSTLGRFINRDPFGYDGGRNLYGFVENNPITGSDPTGYCCTPVNPIIVKIIRGALIGLVIAAMTALLILVPQLLPWVQAIIGCAVGAIASLVADLLEALLECKPMNWKSALLNALENCIATAIPSWLAGSVANNAWKIEQIIKESEFTGW